VALSLKGLSSSRAFYRFLGNTVGARKRVERGVNEFYFKRARNIYELCKRHNVKDGDRLIELGTGWVHWESLIIRLFWDVKIVLYDVWDNRQWSAFRAYCEQLERNIDDHINMSPAQSKRAHLLLKQILTASSFEEVYVLLDWEYVVEPSGTLETIPDNSFDAVYSVVVAEHIGESGLPQYVENMNRILVPGGLSMHYIDLGDHLSYYTSDVCKKNYLRYSDTTWKLLFENNVQYFNRVQSNEWLEYFQKAGFDLVENCSEYESMDSIKIDKQYANLDKQTIDCVALDIVHRKPLAWQPITFIMPSLTQNRASADEMTS
jgi:cyclopropane fatty-acyl-phospholipid synthase-like methyltransferase